ncbi:MAG: hypothetical protein C3F02_04030 [Parcubacteria group bacterium]|nr:MAG: hypothetical protein C3F02_04030 [Parcubacteria group bacterium]
MNVLDIILVVIILLFVWKGFRSGLVGSIGGFLGVLFSIWLGTHYMEMAGRWLMGALNFDNTALANILGFIGLFVAVNIVVSILVMIINRIFHIIPFIDLINKLMGAIVGVLAGVLAVVAFVYLLSLLPISDGISNVLISSQLAHWAATAAAVIKPFVPQTINNLHSIL